MPAYKDKKNGTWYVMVRYIDWTGERKQKCQRGFETKREALDWESRFKQMKQADINMTLEDFYKLYTKDVKPRLKESTWMTKDSIVQSKILPYLGKRKLAEITPKDIVDWQNAIMELPGVEGSISPTYMRTIHNQLSTIFNHAIRFYKLSVNPARVAGGMGKEESREMKFWTKDEYLKFSDIMMDRPLYYYAFQVLYWTGIREGELLALCPSDFDLEKRTLTINKSYQRMNRKDNITSPKNEAAYRTIRIPKFLCEEIEDCLKQYHHTDPDARLFPITKHHLNGAMKRGSKAAGVERIRIHDLRHSHVSLLINNGFTAFEIGKRVGHSAERITYRYAHLFASREDELADYLDGEWNNEEEREELSK